MHFGSLGVEIPIALIYVALWRTLKKPGPFMRYACILGTAALLVALVAWLVTGNRNATDVGLIPVGLSLIPLFIAVFRGERLA